MSDKQHLTGSDQEAKAKLADTSSMEVNADDKDTAVESVKKGTFLILAMIVLSLVWYLVADRYTPYTQQARIDGYVVGVGSEVSGVVKQIRVKNNQRVKLGEILFEIEASQYEIALSKAHSDLEKVKRDIAAGSAGVESSQSNLLAAQANQTKTKQDWNRLQSLYDKDPGAISVRRLEASKASFEQAKAKVAGAKAEIERSIEQKGGEGTGNAKLKSAMSAVDKAELDLKHTTTYASSNGIVTDLRTDVGQYANAGSPMMTLISNNDIWINAEFTENNMGHMKVGTQVELVIDAMPGEVFAGKVRSIGLGVSVGNKPPAGTLPTISNNRDWLRQSQRFPIIIDFDLKQSDELINSIRIGGQAEVIAFTEGHIIINSLAKLYIRIMSWFSYAY